MFCISQIERSGDAGGQAITDQAGATSTTALRQRLLEDLAAAADVEGVGDDGVAAAARMLRVSLDEVVVEGGEAAAVRVLRQQLEEIESLK